MQLFDTYNIFFKAFAGTRILEINAKRYQMSDSDLNYFD